MSETIPLWKLKATNPAAYQAEKARRRAAKPTTTEKDTTMPLPEVIYGVAGTKFDRIVTNLQSTMQRAADATTENATEWKAAKECGVNNKALKLCLSLDRMSDDKRTDFLRAFDAYRRDYFTRWGDQRDMLDAVQDQDGEAMAESETGEAVDEEKDSEPLAAKSDAAAQTDGPAADWGDDKVVEGSSTGAVAAFNDGKEAGRKGGRCEDNPHSGRTAPGKAWKKGWEAGAAELDVIKQEGADARRDGKGMETAPYISDTDPSGAKAWASGWWLENERLLSATGGNVVSLHGVADPTAATA